MEKIYFLEDIFLFIEKRHNIIIDRKDFNNLKNQSKIEVVGNVRSQWGKETGQIIHYYSMGSGWKIPDGNAITITIINQNASAAFNRTGSAPVEYKATVIMYNNRTQVDEMWAFASKPFEILKGVSGLEAKYGGDKDKLLFQ